MEQPQATDLGKSIGRQQAFRLISKKCSAAEAEPVKNLREEGAYKALNLT